MVRLEDLKFGSTFIVRYAPEKRAIFNRHGHTVAVSRWARGPGPINVLCADCNDGGKYVVIPIGNLFPWDYRTKEDAYMEKQGFGLRRGPMQKIRDVYKDGGETLWPLTLWDLNLSSPITKRLKQVIGDDGDVREQCGTAGYKTTLGASKNQVSIFNPQIMAYLLTLYQPPEGSLIYDPFGGGGTRALCCAGAGYNYVGVELRKEEVDAIVARAAAYDEQYHEDISSRITMVHGNAMDPAVSDQCADMLITCPPYYDMEKYQGGENDLSMAATYEAFLDMMSWVVYHSSRILKPGALSCWVIGMHRNKQGGVLPLHHGIAELHARYGFTFKEEVVLNMKNTGSIQRVGNFAKGNNLLVRVHEYCLIFQKE